MFNIIISSSDLQEVFFQWHNETLSLQLYHQALIAYKKILLKL